MRFLLLALVLLFAACSSDNEGLSGPSAPEPAVAQLTIDHSTGRHRLTPEMTQIRVTGHSFTAKRVLTPPQTVPRQDVVTVPLNPSTRTVQIDYLDASGRIVGQGWHPVNFGAGGGGRQTLVDPLYDEQTSDEKPDSTTGQYGLLDPSVHSSPQPRIDPSPGASPGGLDLYAYLPQGWPIALPPMFIPTSPLFGPSPQLPASVTLTNLPAVGAQGTSGINLGYPGSCIAWSFGAELGTFTAARNPDFTTRYTINDSNTASPMYLYEVALKVLPAKDTTGTWKGKPLHCAGSYNIYTSFMVGYGAATLTTLPYEPECGEMERGRSTVATLPVDSGLALGSAYGFWPTDQTVVPATLTLNQIKQFVAGGQAVAFATTIWNNFDDLPLSHGVYYGSACAGGGHGMLIVGYDDTIGAPGQEGAFLVQNSFGTDWPQPDSSAAPCDASPVPSPDASPTNPAGPGRFYLSYGAFYGYNTGGAVAWPVDPSTPSGVTLTGPSGAPAAAINSTYQVTNGANGTYLVLNHWFARPLYMQSLTLTSPDGKKSATQPLGYALKNGYIWTLRLDNRSFQPGQWSVSVATTDGAKGAAYTYTGNVTLGNVTAPFPSLPSAELPSHVVGITGANVAVTGNL